MLLSKCPNCQSEPATCNVKPVPAALPHSFEQLQLLPLNRWRAVCVCHGVHVRAAPHLNAEIIDVLMRGGYVDSYGLIGNWLVLVSGNAYILTVTDRAEPLMALLPAGAIEHPLQPDDMPGVDDRWIVYVG